MKFLFRWAHGLRFLLFDRHRHGRLVEEEVLGHRLSIRAGVLNPALFWTGPFLASVMQGHMRQVGSVLDMGTGSGLLALAAAPWAPRVLAVDRSETAVACARENVARAGLEDRIELRRASLWEGMGDERFDRILCNPPYFSGSPSSEGERPFRDGGFREGFVAGLGRHLAPGGAVLTVLSDLGELAAWRRAMAGAGFRRRLLAELDKGSELLVVERYELDGEEDPS